MKIAVKLGGRGDSGKYVVECHCGWSSGIKYSKHQANAAYAEHKSSPTASPRSPAASAAPSTAPGVVPFPRGRA